MSFLQRWTVAALLVAVAYRTIGAWTWAILALLLALKVWRNVSGGTSTRRRGRVKAPSVVVQPRPVAYQVVARRTVRDRLVTRAWWAMARGRQWSSRHAWATFWTYVALAWTLGGATLVLGWTTWTTVLAHLLVLRGAVVLGRASRAKYLDPYLAIWSGQVARSGPRPTVEGEEQRKAVLPGSMVLGRPRYEADEPTGQHVAVVLHVRGHDANQPFSAFSAARERIAAAYMVPEDCVTVDPVDGPQGAQGEALVRIEDPHWRAHLDRVREDRMARTYPLGAQVMDRANGRCEVGVEVATGEPMVWTACEQGIGAYHGVIAGATRRGKSNLMESLATVMCRSGMVAPAFMDLAGGVTFGDWTSRSVGVARNVREAEQLFEALDAEYERRIEHMNEHGWRGVWRFSEECPLLPLFVDEGPELKSSKRASALLGRAVRLWGKAGMCVVLATQSMTIDSLLGDDAGSVAKDQLMSGNLAGVYGPRDMAGLPFPIKDLPVHVKGAVRLLGPAHDVPVTGRAFLRAEELEDFPIPPVRLGSVKAPEVQVADSPGASVDREGLVRAALEAGPLSAQELAEVTGVPSSSLHVLLQRMAGVSKSGGYGGRWSLVEVGQ